MMTIYAYLISVSCLLTIDGQVDMFAVRSAKSAFDAQFQRGQCPINFYQLANECAIFPLMEKNFTSNEIDYLCVHFFGRSKSFDHIRPLILNTPEKSRILLAFHREYDEVNYAVHLPSDYHTLNRCHDGKDDHWPEFCPHVHPSSLNGSCLETSEFGYDHICLRPVDCDQRIVRIACEFTLPGSSPLTSSTFRQCPKTLTHRRYLSIWAWLLIAVGGMLFVLLILGGVLAYLRKSKTTSAAESLVETNRRLSPMVSINEQEKSSR